MLLLGVFCCASVTDCTQQAVPTAWGRASWPSVLRGTLLSLLQCGDINPTGAMAKPAVLLQKKLDTKTKSQNDNVRGGSALALPGGASAQHLLLVWGSWGAAGALRVWVSTFAAAGTCQHPHWLLCLSCRLIKGDGEVLEEIVSKERHKEINKVVGTGMSCMGWLGTARELLHSEGLCFHPGDKLSPGSTARAPGVVLVVLQPWAGSAVSAVCPLQQATRGDGLAFQVRTGMLQ